ncbi:MAG: prephenate dehydratase [Eggerthellaceae bacterium]|nr:prephenate dehydratase [Eggerthellaceae bacterium]
MAAIERSIAFLGPVGTYTHEAALWFADELELDDPIFVECTTFDEVFDCVDRGRCAFGVVGKENSLEGSVTDTLDNFAFRTSAQILGEKIFDIHHCLVMNDGAQITDIETIASHPQGLAQCRRFLSERFPLCKIQTVSSTAESARLAANDKTIAGIANEFAAEYHGARIEATQIEDHFGNQTAFDLVGRPGTAPNLKSDITKTSVALFLQEDRPGSLLMILEEFAFANINLTMCQSRPTKQQLGDYMFFIEFELSLIELPIQTAINCLRMKLREVKVLGSYPVFK